LKDKEPSAKIGASELLFNFKDNERSLRQNRVGEHPQGLKFGY